MQPSGTKLIFFGNERLVSGLERTNAPILRGLIKRGYTICAVVSHHEHSSSRTARPLEVAEVAAEHGIPVFLPNKPDDIIDELRAYDAEAAVLVAYGRIISQSVIDLFPRGIINIHPSLLPRYRGPTPIESAILNGDSETGVSIMQLTSGMDEGPVFGQHSIALSGTENKFELYGSLAGLSEQLLFSLLPDILGDTLPPVPQDDAQASYCSLLSKSDGLLDPAALSAGEAERRVRALLGFPRTKLDLLGAQRIVTKAHVADAPSSQLDVLFNDGQYLVIDELIAPSGKKIPADAFLRGFRD